MHKYRLALFIFFLLFSCRTREVNVDTYPSPQLTNQSAELGARIKSIFAAYERERAAERGARGNADLREMLDELAPVVAMSDEKFLTQLFTTQTFRDNLRQANSNVQSGGAGLTGPGNSRIVVAITMLLYFMSLVTPYFVEAKPVFQIGAGNSTALVMAAPKVDSRFAGVLVAADPKGRASKVNMEKGGPVLVNLETGERMDPMNPSALVEIEENTGRLVIDPVTGNNVLRFPGSDDAMVQSGSGRNVKTLVVNGRPLGLPNLPSNMTVHIVDKTYAYAIGENGEFFHLFKDRNSLRVVSDGESFLRTHPSLNLPFTAGGDLMVINAMEGDLRTTPLLIEGEPVRLTSEGALVGKGNMSMVIAGANGNVAPAKAKNMLRGAQVVSPIRLTGPHGAFAQIRMDGQLFWTLLAMIGGGTYTMRTTMRGEPIRVNSAGANPVIVTGAGKEEKVLVAERLMIEDQVVREGSSYSSARQPLEIPKNIKDARFFLQKNRRFIGIGVGAIITTVLIGGLAGGLAQLDDGATSAADRALLALGNAI